MTVIFRQVKTTDDREEKKPFILCEVQVFPALGESSNGELNGINIVHEDNDDCGKPEKPVGSEVIVTNGAAAYKCNEGYKLRGKGTRTCIKGIWRGEVPDCEGQ